jgi:hypothetical protein
VSLSDFQRQKDREHSKSYSDEAINGARWLKSTRGIVEMTEARDLVAIQGNRLRGKSLVELTPDLLSAKLQLAL